MRYRVQFFLIEERSGYLEYMTKGEKGISENERKRKEKERREPHYKGKPRRRYAAPRTLLYLLCLNDWQPSFRTDPLFGRRG